MGQFNGWTSENGWGTPGPCKNESTLDNADAYMVATWIRSAQIHQGLNWILRDLPTLADETEMPRNVMSKDNNALEKSIPLTLTGRCWIVPSAPGVSDASYAEISAPIAGAVIECRKIDFPNGQRRRLLVRTLVQAKRARLSFR